MANPFKQAELAKKTAPGSKKAEEKKETVVTEETPKVEETIEVKPVEVKETKKPEQKKIEKKEKEVKETKDIFAGLKTEKAAGKTYAFYLKDENVDKLKKKAEKMGITTSKLLDHILSEVL
jgi:hypothetical protein